MDASLVPPDYPRAACRGRAKLATDLSLRKHHSASGRAHVEREFSAQRVAQAIVKLCDRLLDKAKPWRVETGRIRVLAIKDVLVAHGRRIAVIGFGYVGLAGRRRFRATRACRYRLRYRPQRVDELNAGHDRTREVEPARSGAADAAL